VLASLVGAALLSCGVRSPSVAGSTTSSSGSATGGSSPTGTTACGVPADHGAPEWVRTWCGDGGECSAGILASRAEGDLLVVGADHDSSSSGDRGFVARFSSDGLPLWKRWLPTRLSLRGAAPAADGWIVVGSAAEGAGDDPHFELDGLGVDVRGSVDGVVAKLGEDGVFSWIRTFGDDAVEVPCMSEGCQEAVPVYEYASAVTVDADGTLGISGSIHGDADLLGTTVHTAGGSRSSHGTKRS
jgi:hypothetical protein